MPCESEPVHKNCAFTFFPGEGTLRMRRHQVKIRFGARLRFPALSAWLG